jgi:hypothetical protein
MLPLQSSSIIAVGSDSGGRYFPENHSFPFS